MEEVGARVAVPMFAQLDVDYPYHGPPFSAKKRDYLCHQSLCQRYKQAVQPPFEGVGKDWNPSSWHWDSSKFVVRALESETSPPGKGHAENNAMDGMDKVPGVSEWGAHVGEGEDNDHSLRLNLGGGMKIAEEPVSRPRKRIRPESAGDNYPMCQVDECREDLSNVKDYHRRHKVCEVHSKAANALVGKQMQRFCQQCSRFHLLSEFDEGKRSCRRRLAGHNRRRRKTQSEDVNLGLPGQGNKAGNADKNVDVIHLLSSLTRGQGKAEVNVSAGLDREQIIQFLSKINSLKLPTDCIQNLRSYKSNDVASGKATSTNQERFNVIPSTADLLTVLSSPLPSSAPNATAVAVHSPSSEGSDMDETSKSKVADESIDTVSQKGSAVDRSSVGGERSSSSYQSLVEDSDGQIQQTRPSLQLQLFSSSPEDVSPPKSVSKYVSSDSSNPFEEPSRSSSPVVQELFPMQSLKETAESERSIIFREVNGNHNVRPHVHTKPLDLFRDFRRASDDASHQNSPYRAGSISLSTGNAPYHTGRIMFKLFDKDPSHLPGSLRSQIFNWLSNSPSDMESFIRPGCVVLSVYVSMPSASWEHLESNFLVSLYMLLQSSNCDFWRSGRFLVHASRKWASHKNGRINEFKSGSASLPELISVSPLAVAGGQETSLVLRGRNMNNPVTNIYCTLRGGYMALKVNRLNSQTSTFDEVVVCNFKVLTDTDTDSGRCFIEVENGFWGSSFPIIVADATICKELRLLESELEEDSPLREVAGDAMPNFGLHGNQRAVVLHFLNELGWLFQRKPAAPVLPSPEFSLGRYKFLLTFAVERDYCALVKKILDLSVEDRFYGDIPLVKSLETLSEIQLLNRAVRRQCRKMVDLLVRFCVGRDGDSLPKYLFTPDAIGPGGVTPLHVAASTSGSIDIVDALTNDPQEIGLNGWSSLLDANGMSPHAYAKMTNHHSYNELVACKLGDKEIGQISLTVSEGMQGQDSNLPLGLEVQSCARCAAKSVKYANRVSASSHGLLHRPFMYSILLIAAVCVCVCLLNRTAPKIGVLEPFIWENLDFGTI